MRGQVGYSPTTIKKRVRQAKKPPGIMLSALFRGNKKSVLLAAGLLIAAIAIADWRSVHDLPLGFLYLLPMLMVGRVLKPVQIGVIALLCTFLTEVFDEFVWNLRSGVPRDCLYFAAFFCIGIFVSEVTRNRRVAQAQLSEIERQRDARCEAEEQLKVLIESSPVAILTSDSEGRVLTANEAAHRLLGVPSADLLGRSINRYLPSLANVFRQAETNQLFRTMMQARGLREDGEAFIAEICFSTYATSSGPRLAAMILDTSDELRSREESSLHQILAGSRIVVGAVSHEIRNVCGAIAVVHQNLTRGPEFKDSKDFEALGKLVLALERIASIDLRQSSIRAAEVDLLSVLDDLKIVITPSLREHDVDGRWHVQSNLPIIWAEQASLMQVFLNLTTNSIRALSQRHDKALLINARTEEDRVVIEFTDNGGGVKNPGQLFHPFQPGAQSNGLGLYVSRAFTRSFGGDLRYKPVPEGACFVVELARVAHVEEGHEQPNSHSTD